MLILCMYVCICVIMYVYLFGKHNIITYPNFYFIKMKYLKDRVTEKYEFESLST